MLFKITVGLITIILALNGLIFQTKKDPNGGAGLSNLNNTGRLLLVFILLLGGLNITKSMVDDRSNAVEGARKDAQITNLEKSQKELLQTNQHLIKVMSVATGYNALIRGVVAFTHPVSEAEFRHAAENLFLKYVSVKFYARNNLGSYEGEVDFGTHPTLWKFRNLSQVSDDMVLSKYRNILTEVPMNRRFFYEIRCNNLKILSRDKIQYAKLDDEDDVQAVINKFPYSGDFGQLYNVDSIYIDEVQIEELGTYRAGELLRY
jgi:hypothetical protein